MATLSEAESKAVLAEFGLPVLAEGTSTDVDGAVAVGDQVGYPCVAKLCGSSIAHKTERNLVRLGLADDAALRAAATELLDAASPTTARFPLLVAPMVRSSREFIVGADRTDEFGPVVMIGVGGIFAEVARDVTFRLLPAERTVVEDMLDDLRHQALLDSFRGEPPVDRDALVDAVMAVGQAMVARDDIRSIDVNPLLIDRGAPVAVDALVEVE